MEEQHYFTGHTNARLTFVIGVVSGMTLMTLTGVGFFVYVFMGGNIQPYAIAPLDTESQILTEPIKAVENLGKTNIAQAPDTHIVGARENYVVTLVQYQDYECRFCKKFFPDVLDYVNAHADKVRLIIKQFPLVQLHPNAKLASQGAECAAVQNRIVDYSVWLYEHQANLNSETILETLPNELNLDAEAFKACTLGEAVVNDVTLQAEEAAMLGIQTQPNLLIVRNNGEMQLIDGYVNMSYLDEVLKADLE